MNTKRIRRVRETAPAVAPKKTKHQMLALLQTIAKMKETMVQLQKNIDPLLTELEEGMIAANLLTLESSNAVAEISQSSGKKQIVIDPRKLFNKVSEDEFFECVTVGVTKAKSVLSEKELARISTTIPGKTGPKKLTVTLV